MTSHSHKLGDNFTLFENVTKSVPKRKVISTRAHETVENLLSSLKTVDGVHGSVMAAVTWSYAASLATALAIRERMDDPNDSQFTQFRKLSPTDLAARLKRQDQRIMELSSIVSWAKEEATPDFTPTGETVVARVTIEDNTKRITPEAEIKRFMDTQSVTLAEATAAFEGNSKQNMERQALTRATILRSQKTIAAEIDAALRYESGDFELSPYDASRILEKAANKCDQYEQQRLRQVAGTRNPFRLASVGAERRILIDIMNQAFTLANQMADEAENSSRNAFLTSTSTETMEDEQPNQAAA